MSAESLNVIALISGGKDSFFSLLHCLHHGHKIVALANLYPPGVSHPFSPTENADDLDSFMYQTVGHHVVPLYFGALKIPLLRHPINGTNVQRSQYYDSGRVDGDATDETEDMKWLLSDILQEHPEANAVSTGAILSTFQRTRVESVCARLGLTPLAFLWQYPILPPPPERSDSLTGLLDDAGAAGLDARLIKLASGGLRSSLLMKNVTDSQTSQTLVRDLQALDPAASELDLRAAVLGEGGEYETLVFNGPEPLWKYRIAIPDDQLTTRVGPGGVVYQQLGVPTLIPNDGITDAYPMNRVVRVPAVFDPQFIHVQENVIARAPTVDLTPEPHVCDGSRTPRWPPSQESTRIAFNASTLSVVNLQRTESSDAVEQMEYVRESLLEAISITHEHPVHFESRPDASNISFALLQLADMDTFPAVNKVYAEMFSRNAPNPPARVTISADLPPDVKVSLSVVVDLRKHSDRRGLHVQSRSYWAPANIGPYSQSISEPILARSDLLQNPREVHMAGQIPLIPHSMELEADAPFHHQATLSLQHLWRVGQSNKVDVWPFGVAFLSSSDHTDSRARVAFEIWRRAHNFEETQDGDDESDDDIDPWDAKFNRNVSAAKTKPIVIGKHRHRLPYKGILMETCRETALPPPCIVAEVLQVPRNALIEWWSLGMAELSNSSPCLHVNKITSEHGWTCSVEALLNVDQPKKTVVNFCSAGLYESNSLEADLGTAQKTLFGMLDQLRATPSSDENGNVITAESFQFGYAFVSGELGWQVARKLISEPQGVGVAIVPCRELWADLEGAVRGAEPTKNTSEMRKLAFALVGKVEYETDESGSDEDLTQEDTSEEDTGVEDNSGGESTADDTDEDGETDVLGRSDGKESRNQNQSATAAEVAQTRS